MNNKTENVLELFADYKLDALVLTETWHVAIKRLWGQGLNVVEVARLIPRESNLENTRYINHGGIAIASRLEIVVTKLNAKLDPRTFELLCCRLRIGHKSVALAAVYRPGSKPVSDLFFMELASLLESLSTFKCPIRMVGDMNLHLKRTNDRYTLKLIQLLDTFNLQQIVQEPTHDGGGLLDIVISPVEGNKHEVELVDTGLSDHRLVCWSLPVAQPHAEFKTI